MSICSKLKFCRRSKPTVLELDLTRGIISTPPSNPFAAFQMMNATTMRALREGLRKAAKDERVQGLVVYIGTAPLTPAQGDEVVELLVEFGKHKPTVAFAESFGEFSAGLLAYRVAAACQEVWLQPSGSLALGGVHLETTLLKGLLTKAGIAPQFGQRHEYKTAADRFAADEFTGPHKEMMSRLATSIVDSAVSSIAANRKLSEAVVWESMNAGALSAEEAKDAGFVDQIGYRDEALDSVHERFGTQSEDLMYVSRYGEFGMLASRISDPRKDAVALVSVVGGIVTGRGNPGGFGGQSVGSDVVCEHLRAAVRDEKVKAVLLLVDSPGGSYIASDTIRRAVQRVRESGRPVVAVMGNVAASGGYFVSMGADEIVAAPTTLTGSIGVLAGKMVTQGLYDKLGLKRESFDAGELAGMLGAGREFTEREWAELNRQLDAIYEDFTTKAAADRKMAVDELEPLARGRVWTGADAAQRGLVDHLGGMDLGMDRVCALAGLDRESAQLKPIGAPGFIERFRPARSSESLTRAGGVPLDSDALIAAAANMLGITLPGVLSLPMVPRVKG